MSKSVAVLIAACLLPGCVIVPADTAGKACHLIYAANMEAELAPGWHDSAGDVLVACGIANARDIAEVRACEAQKRAGYDC